jgi:hypothetical protein
MLTTVWNIRATVANVSYREFQFLCSDCLAQMLDQESSFRLPGIPFYLLCEYMSRMASTTKPLAHWLTINASTRDP